MEGFPSDSRVETAAFRMSILDPRVWLDRRSTSPLLNPVYGASWLSDVFDLGSWSPWVRLPRA